MLIKMFCGFNSQEISSTDDDKATGSETSLTVHVEGDSNSESESEHVADSSQCKLKSKPPSTKGKKNSSNKEANVCNSGSDMDDSSLETGDSQSEGPEDTFQLPGEFITVLQS